MEYSNELPIPKGFEGKEENTTLLKEVLKNFRGHDLVEAKKDPHFAKVFDLVQSFDHIYSTIDITKQELMMQKANEKLGYVMVAVGAIPVAFEGIKIAYNSGATERDKFILGIAAFCRYSWRSLSLSSPLKS